MAESVDAIDGVLVITAHTRDGPVACPGCGMVAGWEHSRYVRHVADEAVGGRPVRIDLSVRRLYCENPQCVKVTFVEQVDGLTRRHQRRTPACRQSSSPWSRSWPARLVPGSCAVCISS
ncbi:transposase family protein [Streptomyces minutiscleroticus]|uniref:transposase family protein n=1 Tax=Streptomyces minutiscleroticus TaxID=68238 RepID=UPI00167D73E0|nr:transposase family protein [Streptomyces minutiscleroticus]